MVSLEFINKIGIIVNISMIHPDSSTEPDISEERGSVEIWGPGVQAPQGNGNLFYNVTRHCQIQCSVVPHIRARSLSDQSLTK